MLFEAPGRPDDRQLRQFAWALLAFVTLAISLRIWRGHSIGNWSLALAVAGWAAGALGGVSPRRVEWVFVAATTLTRPVGLVVSEGMLAGLYFCIVTPVAVGSPLPRRR